MDGVIVSCIIPGAFTSFSIVGVDVLSSCDVMVFVGRDKDSPNDLFQFAVRYTPPVINASATMLTTATIIVFFFIFFMY